MNERPVPLRLDRLRSFGDVFSDSTKFIRQNFSAFFKTILFLVGPFLLISCTLSVYYQLEIARTDSDPLEAFNRLGSVIAQSQIIDRIAWLLNGLVTAIVVSNFFKVRGEKGDGKFTVSDVASSIFRDFLGNFLTFFWVLVIAVAFGAVVFVIIFGMASSSSVGGSFLLVFGGGVGYLLLSYPVWFWMFAVFFARTTDPELGVFSALGYAQRIISGSYWKTWAIFFCFWLLLYVVALCISIPASVLTYFVTLWSTEDLFLGETSNWQTLQIISTSLAMFGKAVVYSCFMVGVAMHFYSLREADQGDGLRKQIDEIGKREEEHIDLMY